MYLVLILKNNAKVSWVRLDSFITQFYYLVLLVFKLVKHIVLILDDKEHAILDRKKKKSTWKEFLVNPLLVPKDIDKQVL